MNTRWINKQRKLHKKQGPDLDEKIRQAHDKVMRLIAEKVE